jgi:uncharacterized protein DUF3306
MSDDEFLARWSRRKREARAGNDAPAPARPAEPQSPAAPLPMAADSVRAEVDLSNLPPIESITAVTDVTAFLRQGIPPELSRAALRRAWASDPSIRDFVGLAENAWDFNDPHAMPGFGPLDFSDEQLGALVDRIVGSVRSAADSPTTATPERKDSSQSAHSDHEPPLELLASEAVADLGPAEEISSDEPPSAPAAVQPEAAQSVESDQTSPRRRAHGSALPR